ncbi:MAG: Tfp pilus assembly protein FimT/FimU [Bacilli bacterium]
MSENNKKGFTLTELLATLIILGVIIAIAVPSYNNLSKRFEKEYYDKLEDSVLAAAKTYWKDNSDERPKEYLESNHIYLRDLVDNKYIDSVNEYKDKDSKISKNYTSGYALIIKDKDKYDYAVCLNGSQEATSDSSDKEKYCDEAWLDNENITKCDENSCPNKDLIYLYYDPYYLNNKENQNNIREALGFYPNYKKFNNDKIVLKEITLNDYKIYPKNITSINKRFLDTYQVEYLNGITKNVEIFQYPAPVVEVQNSTIMASITEEYVKKYFGREIADDNNDVETEFNRFQISENGKDWLDCAEQEKTCEKTYAKEGEYKVKFRVVDNFGNVGAESQEKTVSVKGEETLTVIPKLENEDGEVSAYLGEWNDSQTIFTGNWTNQNVKFEIIVNLNGKKLKYSIDGKEQGEIKVTNNEATITKTVKEGSSYEGTYKFWIENTELSKEIKIKIDKVPPKLTISTITESGKSYSETKEIEEEYRCLFLTCTRTVTVDAWTNETVLLKANPIDNESGLSTVSYKKGLFNFNYPLSYDQNYSDYIDDSYISKTIKITAYDNAGNSTTVETKINIDKISPYCSLSIDNSNDQIVYSSHDWEILGIGLGSGVAKDTFPTGLTGEWCSSISNNITGTCFKYKVGTFNGTVEDKAGNSFTCSITVPSKTTTTTEVTLSAPTITLNKTSTSSSPSTTDITFTLSNPNSVGTLRYALTDNEKCDGIPNNNWKEYKGSAVTLINTTGSKTVCARVEYNDEYSTNSKKTGYCNKDIATHDRYTNGKDNTGCWIQFWMAHNSDYSVNSDVAVNRFQYAYWNAEATDHTTNQYWGTSEYNDKLYEKCSLTTSSGEKILAPPQGVTIFDSANANGGKNSSGQTLTKKLYQKYSSQYYCFAIREYRSTEITSVNRWKVWYKNAHTGNECPESGYTSQRYGG